MPMRGKPEKACAGKIGARQEGAPRWGGCAGLRAAKRELGVSSRAILRRLLQHCDEQLRDPKVSLESLRFDHCVFVRPSALSPAPSQSQQSNKVQGSEINIRFYTPLRETFFGRAQKNFLDVLKRRDVGYAPRYKLENAEEEYWPNRSAYVADEARIAA